MLFSAEQNSEQGMEFVYILVGFTGECLNRQTAAGLPSQQLINNSLPSLSSRCLRVFVCVHTCVVEGRQRSTALMIVRKGRHDLLFPKSESAIEQILQRGCIYKSHSLLCTSSHKKVCYGRFKLTFFGIYQSSYLSTFSFILIGTV